MCEFTRVPLNRGMSMLIDTSDLMLLGGRSCYVNDRNGLNSTHPYAGISFWIGGKSVPTLVHRLIMAAPNGLEVDHINGDTLDNRRSNLRLCTHAENQRNRKRAKNNQSGFRGVHRHSQQDRWIAQITVRGQRTQHVGSFPTAEEAARAYDAIASVLHGDFASLNFPKEKCSHL